MKRHRLRNIVWNSAFFTAMLVVFAPPVHAASFVGADCDSFGSVPGETFGGSGIPNNAVCQSTGGGLTINLEAHGRFVNPQPTNDGAGTYFVGVGGDVLDGQPALFTWNFGYGITNNSNQTVSGKLYVDTANAANTDTSLMAVASFVLAPGQGLHDSQNDAFNFWQTGIPGVVTPSSVAPDVNSPGEFNIAVVLAALTGETLLDGRILVVAPGDDTTPVPEPTTFALLGLGLIGGYARRRRQQQ